MKIRWWPLVAALTLVACAEEDQAAVEEPAPVAPVTVSVDGEEESADVTALQARVDELEEQLADQDGDEDGDPPAPTGSSDIPDGVDTPEPVAIAEEVDGEEEAQGSEETEGSTRRRRRRPRDDETVILNPLDILLGE